MEHRMSKDTVVSQDASGCGKSAKRCRPELISRFVKARRNKTETIAKKMENSSNSNPYLTPKGRAPTSIKWSKPLKMEQVLEKFKRSSSRNISDTIAVSRELFPTICVLETGNLPSESTGELQEQEKPKESTKNAGTKPRTATPEEAGLMDMWDSEMHYLTTLADRNSSSPTSSSYSIGTQCSYPLREDSLNGYQE